MVASSPAIRHSPSMERRVAEAVTGRLVVRHREGCGGPLEGHAVGLEVGDPPLAVDGAPGPDALGRVFDDRKTRERLDDVFDRRHLAEQIDWDAGLRTRSSGRSRRSRQDVERLRIDVDEHRLCTNVVNRSRGGEEGERRGDHFIASATIQRAKRQEQCVRPARATDGELGMRQLRDLPLERFHWSAEDEKLGVDGLHHRCNDFIADRRMLRTEIQQRNRHCQGRESVIAPE